MEQGPTVWEMSSGGYQVYGGGKLAIYSVSLSIVTVLFLAMHSFSCRNRAVNGS